MKQLYLTAALALSFSLSVSSQSVMCDSLSNVIIYSNYDGGILNIDVDVNIPNLKIGVVSYEAVQINITGTYAGNVSKVWYAGYNGTNDNCNLGVTNTTISGVPASVDTITIIPAATMNDPNGYPYIICAYQCATGNQGGCNTPDQVVDFFLNKFNEPSVRFHRTRYNCWNSTIAQVSALGNCCMGPIFTQVEEQDAPALSVVPNPASSVVRFSPGTSFTEDNNIQIHDATGRVVKEIAATPGVTLYDADVSDLAPGLYLVTLRNGEVRQTASLIIE